MYMGEFQRLVIDFAASAERDELVFEYAVGLSVAIAKSGIWRLKSHSTKSEGETLSI